MDNKINVCICEMCVIDQNNSEMPALSLLKQKHKNGSLAETVQSIIMCM